MTALPRVAMLMPSATRARVLDPADAANLASFANVVTPEDDALVSEKLSDLDAKLRVEMRAEIKTLHQKVRTTSIYVTHDQIEAMTLADRIVVLNQGYIEQQGTPRELYRHPASIFVASFIGAPSMNYVDATVQSSDTGPIAELVDGTIIAPPSRARVTPGQKVTVGIRPEHIVPGNDGTPMCGMTAIVEPTGAQAHMLFELAGQQLTAVVDGETTLGPGSPFIEPWYKVRSQPPAWKVFQRGPSVQ